MRTTLIVIAVLALGGCRGGGFGLNADLTGIGKFDVKVNNPCELPLVVTDALTITEAPAAK